ncbi:MAG: FAD-dependent oxidoreductase [Actinobacteria bacterium]|nr:FAD-dependent oxidoreductase [Actinomycetota bacterium]
MTDRDRTSLWLGTAPGRPREPLAGDWVTDVVVVGAGITGLTTALLLAEAGLQVTVLEARAVGHGTTGGTTGKVTSQHGAIYADLREMHGDEVAGTYARLNEAAVATVRDLAARHAPEAAFETLDAFVYTEQADQLATLQAEVDAAQRLGLPADWVEDVDLPFPTRGAVRFRDQGQMHAVRYVQGLADAVEAHQGCSVRERTRVTGIRGAGAATVVETPVGEVTADAVVLATLLPIIDRGFEFARARASRAYGVAALADDDHPAGMYISSEDPTRSIRHHREGEQVYAIVVGESHETGHGPDRGDHDDPLAAFARDRLGRPDVRYRWSAQDFLPADKLPFVGVAPFSERVHVASGFNKWGLTGGTAAAGIIRDLVLGRDVPEAEVLSPSRTPVTAGVGEFLKHNAEVAARFVGDRVSTDAASIDDIPPGGGGIVRVDGKLTAVARDDSGATTTRSAICRHLGCVVQWNQIERSFDCPCHGSRYDVDGTVLEGPATAPLADRDDG